MNLRGRLLFLLGPAAVAMAVHAVGLMLFGHVAYAILAIAAGGIASGFIGFTYVDEPFACAVEPVLWAMGLLGILALSGAYVATGASPATFAALAVCIAGCAGGAAMAPITSATFDDSSPTASERWLMRLACLAPVALIGMAARSSDPLIVAFVGGVLIASCVAAVKIAPQGALSLTD